MPLHNTKSARPSDGDVQVNERKDSRDSKQPVFQVINTMDESHTDIPSHSGMILLL